MDKQVYFDDRIYLSSKNWQEEFDEFDSVLFSNMKIRTFRAIQKLYLEHDFTARQICDLFGVPFKTSYNKLFYDVFGPKGRGHGGARHGAGRRK